MKFQYSAVTTTDLRGKLVKRPVLRLEMKTNDGTVDSFGLIDSGADSTTINLQYADMLGVKLDKAKTRNLLGIGNGNVPVYAGHFPFKIKDMGIEMDIPAYYIDSENVNILLGQEVFFEKFRIKFEKDHDTFELTQVSK